MTAPASLRDRLREATRSDHERLDAAMSKFDLSVAEDYARFLLIHRSAIDELRDNCRMSDGEDFDEMRRCLDADLSRMTRLPRSVELAPAASRRIAAHASQGYQMGTAYVLRGSRLGAAWLIRRIADAAPNAYLSYRPSISWVGFLHELDDFHASQPTIQCDQAELGAKEAFQIFLTCTESACGADL